MKELELDRLQLENDIRNDMRDLFFFLNFPLMALTTNFLRELYFHHSSGTLPSLSKIIGNRIPLGVGEGGTYLTMTLLAFLPTITIAVSHIWLLKRLLILIRRDRLDDVTEIKKILAWDTAILFVGVGTSMYFLPPLFESPYLVVLIPTAIVPFFLYKVKVLFDVPQDWIHKTHMERGG